MLARLQHFLIPSESNNFRAKALHHSSLTSLAVIFLAFQLILSSFMIIKPNVLGFASQISPEKVLELTNQERAKVGAPPLTLNSILNESAQRKAGDMFAFNYWAHSSPSGRTPWDFFKEAGYRFSLAGENLARDFASPEAVVSAWMASPTHKENILNPNFREIGIAVVDGSLAGGETTLVVQHFGVRTISIASKSVPVPVAAKEETETKTEPQIQPQPEITLQPVASVLPEATGILTQATGKERPLVSPFDLTQKGAIIFLGGLILAIVIDGVLVWRKKVFRLSGHSLAHGIFLAVTLLMIIFSREGAIL